MKNLCFLVLLYFINTALYAQEKRKVLKNDSIYKITFRAMNIGAETEFSITCNRFDSMSLEVRDITKEKSSIAKMLKGIRVNDTKYSNVDTRSKLYIYYTSGRVDQYCFHRFNNCLKNGSPMLLLNTDLPYYFDSMRQAFKLPD